MTRRVLLLLLLTLVAGLPQWVAAQSCGMSGFDAPIGCSCRTSWSYGGQSYCGCNNPDGDPDGPWCFTNAACNGETYATCVPVSDSVYSVQIAVLVDHSLFLAKGAGARTFAAEVIDRVKAIYAISTLVVPHLSGVLMFSEGDPWNITAASTLEDYLNQATNWASVSGNIGFERDNVIVLTNLDLSGSAVGLGWQSSICSSRFSVSLVEATATAEVVAARVAHQLGHNLGAAHDGASNGCTASGFLMGPTNDSLAAPSTAMSSCTIAYLNAALDSATCLRNIPQGCGDGVPCDDGDECSDDDHCESNTCIGGGVSQACSEPTSVPTAVPTATPTPIAGDCPAVPAECRAAGKSSISFKTNPDSSRQKFQWKWGKGLDEAVQSDFGDPVAGDPSYTLCLYDQADTTPVLKMSATVRAGGSCADKPCWKAVSDKGWAYKNKTNLSNGINKVAFKGGVAGKSSLQVAGKGAALPLPAPAGATHFFDHDVVVQLHGSNPQNCWSSTFTTAKKNDGEQYKAVTP